MRGREQAVRQHLGGLGVFALTLVMTSGALGLLHLWDAAPPTWLETAVLGLATACSTLVRFVAMRRWIFRSEAAPSGTAQPSPERAEVVEVVVS